MNVKVLHHMASLEQGNWIREQEAAVGVRQIHGANAMIPGNSLCRASPAPMSARRPYSPLLFPKAPDSDKLLRATDKVEIGGTNQVSLDLLADLQRKWCE